MAGGGSLLIMPVMVLLGLPGPVANGTTRVAILAQNVSATAGFRRLGLSDLKLSLTLSACALPGAVAGAFLGTRLEGVWFNRVLAGVMIAVLALMALGPRAAAGRGDGAPVGAGRLAAGHALMVAAGLYGGFIQAGVGFIMMAILHRVLGLDLVRVNMHKVFVVGTYTIAAIAVFAWRGDVIWTTGLILAAGTATGGWIGSHVAVKKGERTIRAVLYIALIALAVSLLAK
jgi:uncharacterized protein